MGPWGITNLSNQSGLQSATTQYEGSRTRHEAIFMDTRSKSARDHSNQWNQTRVVPPSKSNNYYSVNYSNYPPALEQDNLNSSFNQWNEQPSVIQCTSQFHLADSNNSALLQSELSENRLSQAQMANTSRINDVSISNLFNSSQEHSNQSMMETSFPRYEGSRDYNTERTLDCNIECKQNANQTPAYAGSKGACHDSNGQSELSNTSQVKARHLNACGQMLVLNPYTSQIKSSDTFVRNYRPVNDSVIRNQPIENAISHMYSYSNFNQVTNFSPKKVAHVSNSVPLIPYKTDSNTCRPPLYASSETMHTTMEKEHEKMAGYNSTNYIHQYASTPFVSNLGSVTPPCSGSDQKKFIPEANENSVVFESMYPIPSIVQRLESTYNLCSKMLSKNTKGGFDLYVSMYARKLKSKLANMRICQPDADIAQTHSSVAAVPNLELAPSQKLKHSSTDDLFITDELEYDLMSFLTPIPNFSTALAVNSENYQDMHDIVVTPNCANLSKQEQSCSNNWISPKSRDNFHSDQSNCQKNSSNLVRFDPRSPLRKTWISADPPNDVSTLPSVMFCRSKKSWKISWIDHQGQVWEKFMPASILCKRCNVFGYCLPTKETQNFVLSLVNGYKTANKCDNNYNSWNVSLDSAAFQSTSNSFNRETNVVGGLELQSQPAIVKCEPTSENVCHELQCGLTKKVSQNNDLTESPTFEYDSSGTIFLNELNFTKMPKEKIFLNILKHLSGPDVNKIDINVQEILKSLNLNRHQKMLMKEMQVLRQMDEQLVDIVLESENLQHALYLYEMSKEKKEAGENNDSKSLKRALVAEQSTQGRHKAVKIDEHSYYSANDSINMPQSRNDRRKSANSFENGSVENNLGNSYNREAESYRNSANTNDSFPAVNNLEEHLNLESLHVVSERIFAKKFEILNGISNRLKHYINTLDLAFPKHLQDDFQKFYSGEYDICTASKN